MAKDQVKPLYLPFPAGGVVKRVSYHEQAELTTPSADNVRPDGSISSRERGGSRPGLAKWDSAQPNGTNVIRLINEVFTSASSVYAKHLYVSAGGSLYRRASAGSWTEITSATNLSSDRPLTSCDVLGNVYISSDDNVEDRIVVWATAADTFVVLAATAGTVPTNCFIVASYRDRLLCAGDRDNPHVVYGSKMGDPTNWDITEQGVDASWELATAEAGRIGHPVTALIPHGDDCCIVGCSGQLWTIRSDPGSGGQIDNLSRTIGIYDYTSWCHDSEGNLWFISYNDGLYFMPAGCGDRPVSVSREKIPEEFLTLVRGTDTVTMVYDVRDRGIHIVVNGSSDTAYFVDIKIQRGNDIAARNWASFWPQSYVTANHYAHYMYHTVENSHAKSEALWGGADGYLRHHDHTTAQDVKADDTNDAITSHVYHLIPLAGNGQEGVLTTLELVTATGSGDVDIAVSTGANAEAAFDAAAEATLTFNTAGWNLLHHPRLRGNAAALKVQNGASNEEWAIEELIASVAPASRRR